MQIAAQGAKFLNEYEQPSGKHYIILGMSWAGWLFDFYDLMLFSFLTIPIQKSLGLSSASLSLIIGASLAATALGGILFLSLLVFRVLTGLGVGGEWATGQTLVGETFPARIRARFAAVMQTGAPLGIALASVVGGFLEPAFSRHFGPDMAWRGCFLVSVLPALLVVLIRRFMPESDIWISGRHKKGRSEQGYINELLFTPHLRRWFGLGLILAITDMSAYWFTYSWLPKYLYDQLGFSMAKSAIWMIVTQLGGFLGYLSFGLVADWRGRRIAYTGFSLVWAAGLLAITWFWSTIALWPGLTLVFSFLVGIGTGNFSGYGPIFSEIFPTKVRSTAMGTAFNLARGVQFFTPLIITGIAGRYGLGGGISLAAFFAVFTGAWVWTLPETRGTKIIPD
jgi:putative MFS transporter